MISAPGTKEVPAEPCTRAGAAVARAAVDAGGAAAVGAAEVTAVVGIAACTREVAVDAACARAGPAVGSAAGLKTSA